ncbi:hypothetical protein M1349_01810 [Patescibacteria group bacterium]|nr:hypothetical protein [Patescibacteria group bacterium]
MSDKQHSQSLQTLLQELKEKLKNSPSELYEYHLKEYRWFIERPKRLQTYEHRPIPIREWIDALYGSGLKKIIRPKIREVLIEIFNEPGKYDEVVIIGGIGIGKSFLSGAGVAYLIHRLLCLKNPKQHFGLAGSVPIAIMNMSVNALQAKTVVFGQIVDAVKAPWFKINNYLPDPNIKSQLKLPKNIEVIPGNSQDTYFVGYDLFSGILDEGAWHEVTDEKDYAEEGYNAMQRRIKSRFPGKGMLFIITSPRYVDDFVERKFKEAETNPRIYAKRIRSWESLPKDFDTSSYFYFDPDKNIIYDESKMTTELYKVLEKKG